MIDTLRTVLRDNFILRWTLANMIGWSIGLLAGLFNPICFIVAGAAACICVGVAQWYVLRPQYSKDWIVATVVGGLCGTIPALFGGLMFIFGWGLIALCSGALFGGAIGVSQWLILKRTYSRAEWWIGANALGGLLCGLLTTIPLITGLPIGLLLGSAVYGYITGRALEWMAKQPPEAQSATL